MSLPIDQISAAEIQFNLGIMNKALSKGLTVDEGFIEIFGTALESLRADSTQDPRKLVKVTRQLEQSASRLLSRIEASNWLKPKVTTPLLGDLKGLNSEALKDRYSMRSIRGDGHCLFRAVAAEHLRNLKGLPADRRAEEAKRVAEEVKRYNQDKSIAERAENYMAIVAGLAENRWEAILRDQAQSDALVQFLRCSACAYNQSELDKDSLAAQTADYGFESEQDYFDAMTDMSRAELGGHLELHALAELLGARIHIVHSKAPTLEATEADFYYHGPENAAAQYALLFNPGHYNVAVPK